MLIGLAVVAFVLATQDPLPMRAEGANVAVTPTPLGRGCPVLADLPYYSGTTPKPDPAASILPPAPPPDRFIPPRPPMQDPCALRLLPMP
jgi:hypothetical protein